jgi:hypothetical protein
LQISCSIQTHSLAAATIWVEHFTLTSKAASLEWNTHHSAHEKLLKDHLGHRAFSSLCPGQQAKSKCILLLHSTRYERSFMKFPGLLTEEVFLFMMMPAHVQLLEQFHWECLSIYHTAKTLHLMTSISSDH